ERTLSSDEGDRLLDALGDGLVPLPADVSWTDLHKGRDGWAPAPELPPGANSVNRPASNLSRTSSLAAPILPSGVVGYGLFCGEPVCAAEPSCDDPPPG